MTRFYKVALAARYLPSNLIIDLDISENKMSGMEDKMKKKADKLTKQSFALLDRIKQRK